MQIGFPWNIDKLGTNTSTGQQFSFVGQQLESNPYKSPPTEPEDRYSKDARMWAMFLHFSTLLGLTAIPLLGFIVPIVIWQVQKDEYPELDAHGRSVTNWMISSLIYFGVAVVLIFFVVGVPLLFLLYILNIVFPLIGGLKAKQGELWEYPLTMRFF